MFLCKKCGQVFNDNVSKHGKAKTPDRKLEYFPCDSEVEPIKLLKGRGKRTKVHILI